MQNFTEERFERRQLKGRSFAPARFERCHFYACSISADASTGTRARASHVILDRCTFEGAHAYGAWLSDVSIVKPKLKANITVASCILQRVTIAGKVSRLLISDSLNQSWKLSHQEKVQAYSETDWALDIAELDCNDLGIRGIPVDLIRRDPDHQVVVRRAHLEGGRCLAVDLSPDPPSRDCVRSRTAC